MKVFYVLLLAWKDEAEAYADASTIPLPSEPSQSFWRKAELPFFPRKDDELYLPIGNNGMRNARFVVKDSFYSELKGAAIVELKRIDTWDGILKEFMSPSKGWNEGEIDWF